MKQIFQGEVYEILPLTNGIIFSYCKDITDGNITVSYKMISFDTGRISDITKNVYLMTKFGTSYTAIMKHCDNYITSKSIILANGKVLLLLSDGTAKLIDTNSDIIWQGSLSYRTYTASDMVIYKNSLWTCFCDCNVLLRYNLNTMREELRIGGNKSPFHTPKNMFLEGEKVIVCNRDAKKLTTVNLENYVVLDYKEFQEEVSQYLKVCNYEFVILKSGLYVI